MKLMMRVAFVFYEGQGSTNHYEARHAKYYSRFSVLNRQQVHIARGSTVGQFLDRARMEIQKDFKELRNAPVESLLCVAVFVRLMPVAAAACHSCFIRRRHDAVYLT